jgi:hypothetical protein
MPMAFPLREEPTDPSTEAASKAYPAPAREMLEEYASLLCDMMPRLQEACASGERDVVVEGSRIVKRASVSVGVERVAFAASALESSARHGEQPVKPRDLRDLEREVAAFLTDLEFGPDRKAG